MIPYIVLQIMLVLITYVVLSMDGAEVHLIIVELAVKLLETAIQV
jgi:hypothetical protein